MTFLHLRLTIFSLCLLLTNLLQAQIYAPIEWNFKYDKVADNTYDLFVTAKIDSTWYLYDKAQSPDGPVDFYSKVEYKTNISVKEEMKSILTPIKTYDKTFEMVTKRFRDKAIFKQRITVINPDKPATIHIYWEYMTCNAERCLPPTERCVKLNLKPKNPRIKTIKVGKLSITNCVEDQ